MKYKGGKNGSGVYQRLISLMPKHSTYVEMFLGSGAILRRKKPAARSFAYELDRRTIAELAKALPTEHFEPWNINQEWNGVDPLPGDDGISIGFVEPGTSRTNLIVYNSDAFDALKRKYTVSGNAWLSSDPNETLVYVDPPYPNSVRSSPGKIYEFELMAEHEHAELCDLLLLLPCKVMLSGYDNALYNSKLKGWRKAEIPTTNRAGTRVIETVWLNFPEPVELHDFSHAGDNYRERWNITKRVRNWTGQLAAMDPAERGKVLEGLTAWTAEFNAKAAALDAKATAKRIKAAKALERKLTKRPRRTPKKALPDPEKLF